MSHEMKIGPNVGINVKNDTADATAPSPINC